MRSLIVVIIISFFFSAVGFTNEKYISNSEWLWRDRTQLGLGARSGSVSNFQTLNYSDSKYLGKTPLFVTGDIKQDFFKISGQSDDRRGRASFALGIQSPILSGFSLAPQFGIQHNDSWIVSDLLDYDKTGWLLGAELSRDLYGDRGFFSTHARLGSFGKNKSLLLRHSLGYEVIAFSNLNSFRISLDAEHVAFKDPQLGITLGLVF